MHLSCIYIYVYTHLWAFNSMSPGCCHGQPQYCLFLHVLPCPRRKLELCLFSWCWWSPIVGSLNTVIATAWISMPYSPNTGSSACQLAASATDDSANIHVDMMSHTLYHRHHYTQHYTLFHTSPIHFRPWCQCWPLAHWHAPRSWKRAAASSVSQVQLTWETYSSMKRCFMHGPEIAVVWPV